MTRLTLDIRSMPSKKKGRNGPGKTAATEQQAPLLQNTTEAFGAPTESTCEATVTAAPRSKGSGPGNAAATQHQAPLLQNAAEANGAPAESCKATVTRAAPASSVHEHAGAGPFLKPVASTLAPEFSSSELLQRYVEAGTSEQQQPQGSGEAWSYSTGIVQHGAIEELLHSRAGLMIRERSFSPLRVHCVVVIYNRSPTCQKNGICDIIFGVKPFTASPLRMPTCTRT